MLFKQPKEEGELLTIPLDASTSVIRAYLALVFTGQRTDTDLCFKDILRLLLLVNKMDSPAFRRPLQKALRGRVPAEPWAGFFYASQTWDVSLGRYAISSFPAQNTPTDRLPKMDMKDWKGIRSDWIIEVFRIRWKTSKEQIPKAGIHVSIRRFEKSWVAVSNDFNPNPREDNCVSTGRVPTGGYLMRLTRASSTGRSSLVQVKAGLTTPRRGRGPWSRPLSDVGLWKLGNRSGEFWRNYFLCVVPSMAPNSI